MNDIKSIDKVLLWWHKKDILKNNKSSNKWSITGLMGVAITDGTPDCISDLPKTKSNATALEYI